MGAVHRIDSGAVPIGRGLLRDRATEARVLSRALASIGHELGQAICLDLKSTPTQVETPMGSLCVVPRPTTDWAVVVTTKGDMEVFGTHIAKSLPPAKVGYMAFEGRRGLAALNAPVREIQLPPVKGPVGLLVVGKSVLATGCTAISLTRTAITTYSPQRLAIATVFYSLEGLCELELEFPEAEIYVTGEPDLLNAEGLLVPGVGLIEERLGEAS